MARPQHKRAHAQCPFGQSNWADCDTAAAHQWGQCRAMVDGKPEPHQCSRWATDDSGWCGQHYASETEAIVKGERAAAARAELQLRISAYLQKVRDDPWFWVERLTPSVESTRGLPPWELAGGAGLEPAITRVTTGGPTTERPAKPPHRITEADL